MYPKYTKKMDLHFGNEKQKNKHIMEICIRKGEKRDLPSVHELIISLAIYEREPEAVEITLSELEEDGFGPQSIFDFFVAEVGGVIQGFALYYFKYSTWKGRCVYLETLWLTILIGEKALVKNYFTKCLLLQPNITVNAWNGKYWNGTILQ